MVYAELTTQKSKIEFIRSKLSNNPQWAIKGLLRIYENQTEDEQETQSTNNNNGIGFTSVDANILSSFAVQFSTRKFLSPKQMNILLTKMPKYARQLQRIAQ